MGSSRSKMLSGFNHNIKFRGKTYHVQTEDGGRANPVIKTHIYLGGVILDSVQRSYDDILGQPSWQNTLKKRMKVQHLDEMCRLIAGEVASVDDLLGGR